MIEITATDNRPDRGTGHGFSFYNPSCHPPQKTSAISRLREQYRSRRDAKRDLRGVNTTTCHHRDTGSGPSFVHSATMSDAEESAESVHPWPCLARLLIKTNTALPASAACERLFSAAGRIFVPSDAQFEYQLLLKLNRAFVN